jgi:uncharacterized protein (TIGR02284 family)
MKTAHEIVSVLNNLIETNLDRIKGYEKAASDAEDSEIKELCLSFASQSKAFKTQLEQLVREYNGKPLENGSAKGVVYRAAMEVKHSISDSKKSVLSSCETGEDVALENYKHAKIDSLGFPARVVTIILNQNSEIIKALEKIRFFQNVLITH